MTERSFHPFAVLHFLRKTILLYLSLIHISEPTRP